MTQRGIDLGTTDKVVSGTTCVYLRRAWVPCHGKVLGDPHEPRQVKLQGGTVVTEAFWQFEGPLFPLQGHRFSLQVHPFPLWASFNCLVVRRGTGAFSCHGSGGLEDWILYSGGTDSFEKCAAELSASALVVYKNPSPLGPEI